MKNPDKFRFRKFAVYQDARRFGRMLKEFSRAAFPSHEKFSLLSQLGRALDSVVLNIAEGSSRSTDKDFAHFLGMAHASLNEVVACLDIAHDCGYLTEAKREFFLNDAEHISDQLTSFRKKIIDSPTK